MHNNRLNSIPLHIPQRPLKLPSCIKLHKPIKRELPLSIPPYHPWNLLPSKTITQIVNLEPFRAPEEIDHVERQDRIDAGVFDNRNTDLYQFAAFAEGSETGIHDGEETGGVEGEVDFAVA